MLSEADMSTPENLGYWRPRRDVTEQTCGLNWTSGVWRPWPDVKIRTILLSLGAIHIRIHRIENPRPLRTVEGGFPIKRYNAFDQALPVINRAQGEHEVLIVFPWGASRIAAVEDASRRWGSFVIPSPNFNILYPSAVIPVVRGNIERGINVLITIVRAGDEEKVKAEVLPQVQVTGNHVGIFGCDENKIAELIL
jgi:hypothetical protein